MTTTHSGRLPVEGGEMPITVARGAGDGPAIVIVPSIFGIQDDLVTQMAELAGEASYVAAMDPFFRTEPGPLPYDVPDRALQRMQASDTEAAYRDFRALLEHARAQGNGAVIAVGICFGGPFCLHAAAEGEVDGVVTWHGTRLEQALDRSDAMRCPMRLHFGDEDPVVPLESVDRVRAAFAEHDEVEVVVHPGATHGFSHRAARAYHPSAESAAMDAARELARRFARSG